MKCLVGQGLELYTQGEFISLGFLAIGLCNYCKGCWMPLTHKDKTATHAEWETRVRLQCLFIDS